MQPQNNEQNYGQQISLTPTGPTVTVQFPPCTVTVQNNPGVLAWNTTGISDLDGIYIYNYMVEFAAAFTLPQGQKLSWSLNVGTAGIIYTFPEGDPTAPTIILASLKFSTAALWDVNHDGVCDMKDIAIAAAAFGSKPGSSNWNPNADVNGDGKVDMKDIALISAHFGETY
jgi:hypothetical protein